MTVFSLVEFLTYLYYSRKTKDGLKVLTMLKNIYDVIEHLDDNVAQRTAMIMSDLLHHSLSAPFEDIVNVAYVLEKNFVLVSGDPSRYEALQKYGFLMISVEMLIQEIENYLKTSKENES
ncbi:PIN domain-containing protein [Thermofilum pendens]|uniref:hypothetical protein n=1 Tax=Thermofilum pendens TaxID=2269 RepID=UPI00069B4800|nr:hypothetical protein [Thermofilum pendens]